MTAWDFLDKHWLSICVVAIVAILSWRRFP